MLTVVVVAYKKWLMRPRVLAASMDLFCFYRGNVETLPETYTFCNLYVKTTSFFVLQVSFSMFKFYKPDFEAILLSVRELPLV